MIDLKKYEKLAALNLSKEEKEKIEKDLEEIINYFEMLKEVNTEGVEPYVYTKGAKLFLRKDVPGKTLDKKALEKNRKLFDGKFYKVKKIMGD
ncbi:MAG: Asp-tRNA(Asn)/Glu-tRNA(Gln) amidotransferase subunit GatC [Caldisericaceae bacterium]|nr:Asp-tRNA(Asn)/Glu-tRNA(Gln) amidotransferase subunit GatC [Caldisericaceae bacterium]